MTQMVIVPTSTCSPPFAEKQVLSSKILGRFERLTSTKAFLSSSKEERLKLVGKPPKWNIFVPTPFQELTRETKLDIIDRVKKFGVRNSGAARDGRSKGEN
jgi:hypothetical protein